MDRGDHKPEVEPMYGSLDFQEGMTPSSIRRRKSKSGLLRRHNSVLGAAFQKSRSINRRNKTHAKKLRRLRSEMTHVARGNIGSNNNDVESSDARSQPLLSHHRQDPPKIPHSWLYSMLNPGSKKPQAKVYKYLMSVLIILDTGLFIVSTVRSVNQKIGYFLYIHEGFMSSLFCLEYITRLYIITESRKYRAPIAGRLAYMCSFAALVDALSFLPFFIEIIFSEELPTLTYLRIFRLMRILKTESYASACASASRVIKYNSEILVVAFLMCAMLLLFTSTILYYLRPGLGAHTGDGNDFLSIPDCMYLAILMLTGQGVPDGVLPWYTKSVVVLTAVFSVAMFAIPSSMLTWGFEAEAERMAHVRYLKSKKRRDYLRKYKKEPPLSDSSSSNTDGDTSDEDYFKQIAGVSGSDSEDEAKKDAKRLFSQGDKDANAKINFDEFWNLYKSMQEDSRLGRGRLFQDQSPRKHSRFPLMSNHRLTDAKNSEGSSGGEDLLKEILNEVREQAKRIDKLTSIVRTLQKN